MKTPKSNKIIYTLFNTLSALFVVVILLTIFFFTPDSTHAAITIEPLWKVLGSNNNIKTVWTEVKNLVNIVVIAALIFVAFANILRIQINNYAVKKILPTLILAVILTNFSYFICRFMVDLANVGLSLLIDGAAGASVKDGVKVVSNSGKAPGVAGAFEFSGYQVDPDNLWKSLIYILAELTGAIFIFILSFLFFIRNYIIYFLVGLSPLAFMATVLPQTKSAFSSWWKLFLRWTFMPIVSIFWLWLGGIWYSSGFSATSGGAGGITQSGIVPGADFNSDLFALAFAGVCYYLAITTPFKMGGQIMNTWNKAGKWALGSAATVTGARAAYNYNRKKAMVKYETRKTQLQNFIKDKTGLGSGLDIAEDDLKRAQRRRAAIADERIGQSYERRGDRLARDEIYTAKKEGSADWSMRKIKSDALGEDAPHSKLGIPWLEKRRHNKIRNQILKMREGSIEGAVLQEMFDAQWSLTDSEQKIALFKSKDRNGQKLKEGTKEFDERKEFLSNYGNIMYRSIERGNAASKAAKSPIEDVATERQAYHNEATDHETAQDQLNALLELIRIQKAILGIEGRMKKGDREKLGEYKNKLISAGYDITDEHGNVDLAKISSGSATHQRIQAKSKQAERNYDARLAQLSRDSGGTDGQIIVENLPLHLRDMVSQKTDDDGNVETDPTTGQPVWQIEPRDKLERTRMAQYVTTEVIGGGAQRLNNELSGRELALSLKHGNPAENLEYGAVGNFFSGNKAQNTPQQNEKIMEFVNPLKGRVSHSSDQESRFVATTLIEVLQEHGNFDGLKEMAHTMNSMYRSEGGTKDLIDLNAPGLDKDSLAQQLIGIQQGRTKVILGKGNTNIGPRMAITAIKSNEALGFTGMTSSKI